MAQVTVRINGYSYTLGCQDGEEQHLLAMAAEVDKRIDQIRTAAGPSGESRMLAMAALMLADDLFEQERAQGSGAPNPNLSRKLGRLAKRAEEIAAGLEHH
jgi:cell division protein ZapA